MTASEDVFFSLKGEIVHSFVKQKRKSLKAWCKTETCSGLIMEICSFFCFLLWSCSSFTPKFKKYKDFFFAIYHLTAPQPFLGHCQGDCPTKPMLIPAFVSIFDSKVTSSLLTRLGPKERLSTNWVWTSNLQISTIIIVYFNRHREILPKV